MVTKGCNHISAVEDIIKKNLEEKTLKFWESKNCFPNTKKLLARALTLINKDQNFLLKFVLSSV